MDNITKGTVTELKCITYLIENDYNVSIPQKPTRYDFIIEAKDKLLKVQVKSSHLNKTGEAIEFATASRRQSKNGVISHNYKGDGIDFFCTWYDNECYLIPIQECGAHTKILRLVPTKNGQTKNIAFAKNYIAREVLKGV